MADRNEYGAFLWGLIFGGLTGAIVALLLAPKSGAETRTLINERYIDLSEKARDAAEEALARAEALVREARMRTDEIIERASRAEDSAESEPTGTGGGRPT